MYFLGSFLLLATFLLVLMLSGQQEVDLLFVVLLLLCGPTIEGSCLQSTLNLHVVGFDEGACNVDMLAFLQTVLLLLDPELAALRLGDLASPHLPVLTTGSHSE